MHTRLSVYAKSFSRVPSRLPKVTPTDDSDNDTLTEGQPTSVRQPGLTDMSDGVTTAAKKKTVQTVAPCTRGKVCNWDTVMDNAKSHESKTASQACAETNSINSKERHPLLSNKKRGTYTVAESSASGQRFNWKRHGKVWQALYPQVVCAHQSYLKSFTECLPFMSVDLLVIVIITRSRDSSRCHTLSSVLLLRWRRM